MTSMGSENAAYGLSQYYEDELTGKDYQTGRDSLGLPMRPLFTAKREGASPLCCINTLSEASQDAAGEPQ